MNDQIQKRWPWRATVEVWACFLVLAGAFYFLDGEWTLRVLYGFMLLMVLYSTITGRWLSKEAIMRRRESPMWLWIKFSLAIIFFS
jgi:hypothetical protein